MSLSTMPAKIKKNSVTFFIRNSSFFIDIEGGSTTVSIGISKVLDLSSILSRPARKIQKISYKGDFSI